jgi:hypothetical protein
MNRFVFIINRVSCYVAMMVILKLFSRVISNFFLLSIISKQYGGIQLQNSILCLISYYESITVLSMSIHV